MSEHRSAQRGPLRLKRGELNVTVLRVSKDELAAAPKDHRSFYLLLGHIANEVMMLQSLLMRSLHGIRGPQPVAETGLGMALFLTRVACGRLYEAYKLVNTKENGRLLEDLWSRLPATREGERLKREALQGRDSLNRLFGQGGALMPIIRNKLAFHLDQTLLDKAFDSLSPDTELADFHTGQHGTTFFGVADTVAAVAVGHLAGAKTPLEGVQRMADEAIQAVSFLQMFVDGYLLAFSLAFLDLQHKEGETIRLQGLPEVGYASIGFFLASTLHQRRRRGSKKAE